MQSFEPPEIKKYPAGTLWESVLKFENAAAQIRVALDDDDSDSPEIVAFELLACPENPGAELGGCFNGPEIGKRLEIDCSITLELYDAEGNPVNIENYYNFHGTIYRRIDAIPEDENSRNSIWTDSTDGTHWQATQSRHEYIAADAKSYDRHIFRYFALEQGVYRIQCPLTRMKEGTEAPKGNLWTEPIVLDAANKNRTISAKLLRGATLRIRMIDAETGEPVENAYAGAKNMSAPFFGQGVWNVGNFYENMFPGRYVITPACRDYQADDPVYTPVEEYEVTLADGDDVEIVTKLRKRRHTPEEIDKQWPYHITGTVRDEAGNPLSHAKVTLWGYLGHRPGSMTTTADENGRYTLRFAQHSISGMRVSRQEKPTPEKPESLQMGIEVARPGYVWKGVRTADGQFVSEPFFSKNEQRGTVSRADSFALTCFDPEPGDAVKQSRNLRPETSVYPLTPLSLDLVMQPSVHIRGVILFDEPPEEAAPGDRRAAWQYARLTFDLPREETASYQPTFTGQAGDDFRFEIDALPQKIDVFLSASTRLPASWKQDTIVAQTDFFRLPQAGTYDAVLKWRNIEKQGVRLRRLAIDSLADSDGNDVTPVATKPSQPVDYLFHRWTLHGTVRDDLGQPVEGAEVVFHRHNGWRPYKDQTVTTNSDGMYEIKIKPGNRYPYQDQLHGVEDGEFYIVRVFKEGLLQKNLGTDFTVFLSDGEKQERKSFSFKEFSTDVIVAAQTPGTIDFKMDRTAEIDVLLLDDAGKPLGGYEMSFDNEGKIDRDLRDELKLDSHYFKTDREGKLTLRKFLLRVPGWFRLQGESGENDILRTNNITFAPGEKYFVKLRLHRETDGSRRLSLEGVTNADGDDLSGKIVTEDVRTRPFLPEEETKRGREILQKMIQAISPVYRIENRELDSVSYRFHLGDVESVHTIESFNGQQHSLSMGISFHESLHALQDALDRLRFRLIEADENEIRLITSLQGGYAVGNGVTGTWTGYTSGGFDGAEFVLDAATFLPKRSKTSGTLTQYSDWVAFGDPNGGTYVPLRVVCTTGSMNFDFRFKVHEPGIWLFDRSVRKDGDAEKTICRIDDVQIKKIVWASESDENRVRDALRQYYKAGKYWLYWYPEDLPQFGYTFHTQGGNAEVLSYEDIKSATNWYAEFKRKGISYIGVSRLLVIDIDALRCTRVAEDVSAGTLEFDFVLKQDWMNAVGNGISGSWTGWFNGGVGKGTAILDTKTMTLHEIRTAHYDERYSDYVEIKPGRYVPARIVIDYHKGERDAEPEMFFDFRFKTYETCLWLFDRSVDPKTEETPIVWIDNVLIEGESAKERER